ncbi:MAG: sigma 54-interacting transcriptional regulator [Deltaproteobacteria bacterium]|nr:sigma 54-interacting transcriptional regulator [Deltaproteobacteria bacterium]
MAPEPSRKGPQLRPLPDPEGLMAKLEADEKMSPLLNGLPMGVIMVNGRGMILEANRQVCALLCGSPKNIVGMNLSDLFPIGHVEILNVAHSKRQAAGLILPELQNCFIQLTPISEHDSGAVLSFFDNRLWKPYLGNAAAIDPLTPYISRFIDGSQDGISIIDRHGIMIKVNQSAASFVGVKKNKLEGQHVSYLIRKNLVDAILSLDVIRTGQTISRLVEYRRTGKKVLCTASPVLNGVGEIDLVVMNERDINSIMDNQKKSERHYKKVEEFLPGSLRDANESVKREMVAQSPAMSAVLGTATVLAHYDVSHVLVCGESGTGKSLLARYIHANSRRADQPFVHINCAALPEPLLEAELFGYEKGAFTGSDPAGKAGLLETAGSGTLFLDEIGEMPLSIQAKLLTFLDTREFRRVGSGKALKAKCSVISATNQDLEALVAARQFRQDLSFRLKVFSLTIPPLRKRPEDVIQLAKVALDKFNATYRTNRGIDPLAWDILKAYQYPGNVRELFNIIQQAVLLSDKKTIGTFLKNALVKQEECLKKKKEPQNGRSQSGLETVVPPPLDAAKSELEKDALLRAIAKSRNTRDIASYLGISQASVSRKLRKYGFDSPGGKKKSVN